jgi:hypothetical protein
LKNAFDHSDKSGMASGILPDRTPRGQAQPDKSGGEHAASHRRDEDKRARIEESDIDDRRTWANSGKAPTHAKNEAADNQGQADGAGGRDLHRLAVESHAPASRQSEGDKPDDERAAHHKGQ